MLAFWTDCFKNRCLEASRCGRSTGCSSTPFARWRFTLRRAGVRVGRRRTGLCCKLGEGTARLAGMRESGIIGRHLLPNFAGYLFVNVSLDIPALFVVVTVLAFNFVGDGLRDATAPYK